MQTSHRHLLGIPVRTKSGQLLGRLSDILIDTDTGRLMAIEVRGRGLLPGLLRHTFLVAWSQIVTLSEDEVIVKDGTVPSEGSPLTVSPTPPAPHQKTKM